MPEEKENTQTAAAKKAEIPTQQPRPCPRDCTKCGFQQHAFCAARMSFQMFEVMNNVIQRLDTQAQRLDDLERRIASIQSAETELISPLPVQNDLFTGTE